MKYKCNLFNPIHSFIQISVHMKIKTNVKSMAKQQVEKYNPNCIEMLNNHKPANNNPMKSDIIKGVKDAHEAARQASVSASEKLQLVQSSQ